MKDNKGFTNIIIVLIIIGVLVLISGVYYLNKNSNKNNKEVKTEINNLSKENNNVNENNLIIPSQVPKGTFKNTETGEIFNYIDNSGYLTGCNPTNCKSVYFDIDSSGNIIQIREVKENPIIGNIKSFTLDKYKPETVNYIVEYKIGNKLYQSTYTTQLCDYFKGGDKQCHVPANENTPVIVNLNANNNSIIDNIIIFNKILKTDLIEIVNVNHV